MWIGCKYDDLTDVWLQSEPEAGVFSVSSTSSNRVCRDQRQNPTSPLGYIADVLEYFTWKHCLSPPGRRRLQPKLSRNVL